jgi:TonB family protein
MRAILVILALALAAGCASAPPASTTSASGRYSIPTATLQAMTMDGLRFDPQGADFSAWTNHFKNQAYRNWMVPQAAIRGHPGHVDFEFTLERDGSMSALRMLKSSGTSALDRAARNALTASTFMALPDDYDLPRVTMTVTFRYNEGTRGGQPETTSTIDSE